LKNAFTELEDEGKRINELKVYSKFIVKIVKRKKGI